MVRKALCALRNGWLVAMVVGLFSISVGHAAQLLIPMDDTQSNHLKAYGLAYWLLEQEVEIRLEPTIKVGARVMVKSGPLQGQEGWVEERFGMTTVLLRLDFIGQAAAVEVQAGTLELI